MRITQAFTPTTANARRHHRPGANKPGTRSYMTRPLAGSGERSGNGKAVTINDTEFKQTPPKLLLVRDQSKAGINNLTSEGRVLYITTNG